ncbi:MAG: hypothetical protein QXU64_04405 [Thermofilaceae archaeon]
MESESTDKVYFSTLECYLARVSELGSYKDKLEQLNLKFIGSKAYPAFRDILCSCGAVIPLDELLRKRKIYCDCGNELILRNEGSGSGWDSDGNVVYYGRNVISATKTAYISDYILETKGIQNGKNVIMLSGAYERERIVKEKQELQKKIEETKQRLQEYKEKLEPMQREQFYVVMEDDFEKRRSVAKVVRDDMKREFRVTMVQGDFWDYERKIIEQAIRAFHSNLFSFTKRPYTIRWT